MNIKMEFKNKRVNVGLGWVVFFIFLALKLSNVIDWSWWWVTSPLWLPVAGALAIAAWATFNLIRVKDVVDDLKNNQQEK